jgi:glycosyltransferase involved in cell wall biosynthesis
VISFAFGAAPEVIVDGVTGFLINSVDEMCEAVDRVGEIKPEACREHVEAHFSDDAMVEGYLRAFDAVLSGNA